MFFKWISYIALVLLTTFPAMAADIALCGASDGYAFYPNYGLAAGGTDIGKWVRDPISKGRITLTEVRKNEFDVLFLDATGNVYSSVGGGGKVFPVGKTDKAISLIVIYPGGSSETYSFFRNVAGEAKVMWSQNKYGSSIPKIVALISECTFLAF